ncbi:MAG: hypothetical protein JXA71_17090 [Chitinispirillaceae bacterium]|nr:hypothetical protein [Chitinispirillaceae bacterium]
MKINIFVLSILSSSLLVAAQTQDAYNSGENAEKPSPGLLDPSRFDISHSMSFGMASGTGSASLQSQSFYSTMMQYRFTAPVTLNLNFAMPIHSTWSQHQNLSSDNLQSLDYFKNMPFDVSLSWKPSDRFQFNLSIMHNPYYNGYGQEYGMFDYGFMPWRSSFRQP